MFRLSYRKVPTVQCCSVGCSPLRSMKRCQHRCRPISCSWVSQHNKCIYMYFSSYLAFSLSLSLSLSPSLFAMGCAYTSLRLHGLRYSMQPFSTNYATTCTMRDASATWNYDAKSLLHLTTTIHRHPACAHSSASTVSQ